MQAEFTMQGLDELLRKLQKLDTRTGRKVLRKGTRAASTPMQKAVRNAAPVGPTGNLKKSIERRYKFYRNSTTDVCVVGPRIDMKEGKGGYHGHLVEEGTKERTVKDWMGLAKRGLRAKPIAMPVGKMTPNPFAKRASDAVIASAGHKGAVALRDALEDEIKMLRHGR